MAKAKKTILVVEDDKNLLSIITKKLENCDFKVLTASGVNEALLSLKKAKGVDTIWLDHYLDGEKTGIDFVKEIKKDKKYKSIPIFIVSCSASNEKVLNYIDLGVSEHFVKTTHALSEIADHIRGCC